MKNDWRETKSLSKNITYGEDYEVCGIEVLAPIGYLPGIGVSNKAVDRAELKLKVLSLIEKVTQFSCLISGLTGIASGLGSAVYKMIETSSPTIVEGWKVVCEDALTLLNCEQVEVIYSAAQSVPYGEYLKHLPVVALAGVVFALVTGLVSKTISLMKHSILEQVKNENWGHLPNRLKSYQ